MRVKSWMEAGMAQALFTIKKVGSIVESGKRIKKMGRAS